jgi:signal transduction histidine kinase
MDLPPEQRRLPVAAAAAFVVGAAVLSGLAVVGPGAARSPGWLAVDIVVAVLSTAGVVLLVRPDPPLWVIGALAVLAAVSPAGTTASTAATLGSARTRPLAQAGVIAAIGVAAHLLRYAWRPVEGLGFAWWAVLVVAGHVALLGWGAYARSRAALLESLRERAHRAEADQERRVVEARSAERTRIAREMHDVLAHRLSLVAATAGAMEFRPDASPERLAAAAGVLRSSAHAALEDLREVIGVLRADLDDDERPQPTTADLARLVDEVRDAGVSVDFHDDLGVELAGSTGRTVYRVVQEGLTNARKHAAGEPVEVRLVGGPEVVVEVDNPVGRSGGTPGSGTGLVGLAERVGLAGGRLEHGADRGRFRLVAVLPWPEAAERS